MVLMGLMRGTTSLRPSTLNSERLHQCTTCCGSLQQPALRVCGMWRALTRDDAAGLIVLGLQVWGKRAGSPC